MSSFHLYISFHTLGGLRAFRKPLPYNMYLFNFRIANHILIIIKILKILDSDHLLFREGVVVLKINTFGVYLGEIQSEQKRKIYFDK